MTIYEDRRHVTRGPWRETFDKPSMTVSEALSRGSPAGDGLRYDDGKCRLDLIPPDWEWALGDAMTQGAKKYAEHNWEKGMSWSKCLGCMRRHVLKFLLGERYDKETGCHHLALAAWNCLALMTYDLKQLGENDIFDKDRPSMLWYGSAAVNRDGLQDLKGEPNGTS